MPSPLRSLREISRSLTQRTRRTQPEEHPLCALCVHGVRFAESLAQRTRDDNRMPSPLRSLRSLREISRSLTQRTRRTQPEEHPLCVLCVLGVRFARSLTQRTRRTQPEGHPFSLLSSWRETSRSPTQRTRRPQPDGVFACVLGVRYHSKPSPLLPAGERDAAHEVALAEDEDDDQGDRRDHRAGHEQVVLGRVGALKAL